MTPKPKPKTNNRPRLNGFWLGVTLVALALVLMAWRTWYSYLAEVDFKGVGQRISEQFPTAQPFRDLHKNFEQMGAKPEGNTAPAADSPFVVYGQVPVQTFNPALGPANAPVTLVVLGHAACGRCLTLLQMARKAQALNPMQVRVVMKFLPTDDEGTAIEAALFAAVAQDYGKYWEFIHALTTRPEGMAPDLLGAMETLGVSLQDMRQRLDRNMAVYMRQIGQDMEDAKVLSLSRGPALYVNQIRVPENTDSAALNAHVQAALPRR